jgi:hypothetical protein
MRTATAAASADGGMSRPIWLKVSRKWSTLDDDGGDGGQKEDQIININNKYSLEPRGWQYVAKIPRVHF